MKVLIVDDHELIVEGLCHMLQSGGFQVVGTASDGQEGVEKAHSLNPDLVLMDIRMPRMDGLAATRLIKAKRPDIQIVILTTSGKDQDLFEAVKSGANGYLLKSTKKAQLFDALQGLVEGIPPFSPGLAALLMREFARVTEMGGRAEGETVSPHPLLSERQTEVLKLVASGLSYKEAGAALSLSPETVRYHMREIMDQLHLENRSQVIAYAGKMKLK